MEVDSVAPGLRQLPETLGFVREAFETRDYRALADPTRVDSYVGVLLAFVVVYLGGALLIRGLRGGRRADRRKAREDDRPLRRRRMPIRRRLSMWWIHKFDQPWPWRLGNLTVYLNHTHGLIVGGSGSGKSTAVVALILQQVEGLFHHLMRRLGVWKRRSVLIISFDRSDPIEAATNEAEDLGIPVTRWRVRDDCGWNLLQGDIEMLSEAIPDAWSKTADDTGFFRQLASDGLSAAMQSADAEGVEREWNDIVERADRIMAADPECPDLARQTWVRRFKSLGRIMGPSFGNDFDLASALAEPGAVVHISSNSYTSQVVTPLVGVAALVQAKLAAEQVSDVILILEEAGFLKRRATVLDDLARSMRARGWRVAYLSQNPGDVGEVLQVNFGVAIFMGFGPLATKARQWCADVVKGFPGAFREQELVLGAMIDELEGYVLWKGRCREVSLAPYITGPAKHRAAGTPRGRLRPGPASRYPGNSPGAITQVTEIYPDNEWGGEAAASGPIALPSGRKIEPPFIQRLPEHVSSKGTVARLKQRQKLWEALTGTWSEQADHLWQNGLNGEYGKASYGGKSGWPAHFLFWAWALMDAYDQGVECDLDRVYKRHPRIRRFEWPAQGVTELVVLEALRAWMGEPYGRPPLSFPKDDERYRVELTIDHACPGGPNTRCCNWQHLRVMTNARNSELRHQRRTGEGRLAAERELEIVG